MDRYVFSIYQNCLENMHDTPEDWQKAHDAFHNLYKRSGMNPEVNRDIQICYKALEQHFGYFMEAALPKVREVIGDMDVNQLISDKVKELVEAKMNWYVDESTRQCKLALNEIVTKEAVEKIKSLLC